MTDAELNRLLKIERLAKRLIKQWGKEEDQHFAGSETGGSFSVEYGIRKAVESLERAIQTAK